MIDPNQKVTIRKNGTVSVETVNKEPSMTQQHFKDECDINNILNRYTKTGEFSHLSRKTGQYADFSSIKDYHTMCNQVLNAQDAFMTLPAKLRARFANDPGQLISFLQDEKNIQEGIQLGLFEPNVVSQLNDKTQINDKTTNTTSSTDQTPPAK